MPSCHPRRLFLTLLALPVLFLFLLYLTSLTSRPSISDLFSTTAQPPKLPDEIFGLLHFVTSPDEAGRMVSAVGDPTLGGAGEVAPDKPVAMAWYARGSIARAGELRGARGESPSRGWESRLKVLREEYPLVVFSKVRPRLALRARTLNDDLMISRTARECWRCLDDASA